MLHRRQEPRRARDLAADSDGSRNALLPHYHVSLVDISAPSIIKDLQTVPGNSMTQSLPPGENTSLRRMGARL